MAALQKEDPPSYSEVTRGNDAPPTYEQLFGVGQMKRDMKEARTTSSNHGVFAVKFCSIICSSVACMMCLILMAALPVAMVIIGSIYIHDCPGRRLIPIWLIVFGCFSLLQTTINVIKRIFNRKKEEDEENVGREAGRKGGNCLESLITTFLFVWIILGSVWVFGFYDEYKSCNAGSPDCCDSVPYLFSFITLIVMYSLSFLFIFCFCCCFVCLACLAGIAGKD